ncbi:DUF6153 family protein [Sciscionella marina]|uniref:DUF6153 family protein n=1 Tax=Sciscionella marina TaxID=508770 RepID=UPI00037B862E|nr:DUF6153 family protein [Sciscionella marina]
MGNRPIVRALFGMLLALGLVGMHAVAAVGAEHSPQSQHVVTHHAATEASTPPAAPGEHQGTDHSFMHLCLMVLTFLGLTLLFVLLGTGWRAATDPARGSPRGARVPIRPPRPAGRNLLNLVCISRT